MFSFSVNKIISNPSHLLHFFLGLLHFVRRDENPSSLRGVSQYNKAIHEVGRFERFAEGVRGYDNYSTISVPTIP